MICRNPYYYHRIEWFAEILIIVIVKRNDNFLCVLIFFPVFPDEPDCHEHRKQLGEYDGIPYAVESRFIARAEHMEEDDQHDNNGRHVEDQRPQDRNDSGNQPVVEGGKESGTVGRQSLEQEGQCKDREAVHRDLHEGCVSVRKRGSQRMRQQFDHNGRDDTDNNDERHALFMQILQIVRIAGPVVVGDQRGNAEYETGSDGGENRVDIAYSAVGGNAHIADHVEEQAVVYNVDDGTRNIGDEFR